jgi:vacuolar-type H+-ATPase subunit E/Vma4
MASVDGNVDELTLAIVSEARAEGQDLRAQAQSKADAIRQRAKAEADLESQRILGKAAEEAERLRAQGLATARLKARAFELKQREKLLDNVFAAVSERLPALQERADYQEIARGLAREAVSQLHANKAELIVDEATRKVLTAPVINELSRELHAEVSLGEPLQKGSGVIARTVDGHLNFDNTFETRLARLQGALRSAVHHILAGEAK